MVMIRKLRSWCQLASQVQRSACYSTTVVKEPLKGYKRKIRMSFFYDTISPYSWLAFEILQRYRPIWNLDIDFKPVYMGGVTTDSGNKYLESLTGVPNKAKYIFEDVERMGKFYQVPIRAPESPFYLLGVAGSLKQQRFLTAVKQHYPDYLESCSQEFWYRCWSEDMDATKQASLTVVGNRAGLSDDEIAHCLEVMTTDEIKDKLKLATKEAVDEGAFGLPFMLITDRNAVNRYFGSDRFELISSELGLKWLGPVPDPENHQPLSMPPGQEELFRELESQGAIKFEVPPELKQVFQQEQGKNDDTKG